MLGRGAGRIRRGLWLWVRARAGGTGFQDIVPVVSWGAKAADRGVEGDHALGRLVTCGVGVESAVDGVVLRQKRGKPAGVMACAGGGDAEIAGIKQRATDGVDGGFAQDGSGGARSRDGEVAGISMGTRSHAAPTCGTGGAEFRAHGLVFFSK